MRLKEAIILNFDVFKIQYRLHMELPPGGLIHHQVCVTFKQMTFYTKLY